MIKKYPTAFLFLVCLLMLLPHLGLLQTNIMEARNLISAREMAHNSHWIFTTADNFPRYEKPPLPTWITALFGIVFGFSNMFFLRLPAALATLLLVIFFYRVAIKIFPVIGQAFHAGLILITSFYIFFSGRDNQWDIYTHAFMMLCIYRLYILFETGNTSLKNVLGAGFFFGLSFLSKGPVSFYALLLPFVPAYFLSFKNASLKKFYALVAVVVIGLLIGLSWPVYVRVFDPQNVSAAISQEAGRWGGYNIRPFWYYWSFFTQSGIWTVPALISLIYPYMKTRVADMHAYRFSFYWTIFSVLLLSVIPEKKARYLLPVLIPLALNISFYVEYLFMRFREMKNKKELLVAYFSFGLAGVIAILLPAALLFILGRNANGYLIWIIPSAVSAVICGFVILRGLYRKEFAAVFYSTIIFMCSLVIFLFPVSGAFYGNDQYYAAAKLAETEKKYDIKTYEFNGFTPEIIWDYGNYVTEINPGNRLKLPAEAQFGLLVIPGQEDSAAKKLKGYTLSKLLTVDINIEAPGKKSYNERLIKNYFLVRRILSP